MTVDGRNVGNPPGGNQPPGYAGDVGNSEEITFTTSGGLGEAETAGLVMNVVPKTGGNALPGSLFYSGSGERLQADNTEGTGLAAATPLTKVYGISFASANSARAAVRPTATVQESSTGRRTSRA